MATRLAQVKCDIHAQESVVWACVAQTCTKRFGCVKCLLEEIDHFDQHKDCFREPCQLFPRENEAEELSAIGTALEDISKLKDAVITAQTQTEAAFEKTSEQIETEIETFIQTITAALREVKQRTLARNRELQVEQQTLLQNIVAALPATPSLQDFVTEKTELKLLLETKLQTERVLADNQLFELLLKLGSFTDSALGRIQSLSDLHHASLFDATKVQSQSTQSLRSQILGVCHQELFKELQNPTQVPFAGLCTDSADIQENNEDLVIISERTTPSFTSDVWTKLEVAVNPTSETTNIDCDELIDYIKTLSSSSKVTLSVVQAHALLSLKSVATILRAQYQNHRVEMEIKRAQEEAQRKAKEALEALAVDDPRFRKIRQPLVTSKIVQTAPPAERPNKVADLQGGSINHSSQNLNSKHARRRAYPSNKEQEDTRGRPAQAMAGQQEGLSRPPREHLQNRQQNRPRPSGPHQQEGWWTGKHRAFGRWDADQGARQTLRPIQQPTEPTHLSEGHHARSQAVPEIDEATLQVRRQEVSQVLKRLEQFALSCSNLQESRLITQGPRFTDEEDGYQLRPQKPSLRDLFAKPSADLTKPQGSEKRLDGGSKLGSRLPTGSDSLDKPVAAPPAPLSARLAMIDSNFAGPKEIISNVYKQETEGGLATFFKRKEEFEKNFGKPCDFLQKREPLGALDCPGELASRKPLDRARLVKPARFGSKNESTQRENIPPIQLIRPESTQPNNAKDKDRVVLQTAEVDVLKPRSQNVQPVAPEQAGSKQKAPNKEQPFINKRVVPFALSRSSQRLTAEQHTDRALAEGKSFYFTGRREADFIQASLPQETFISTLVLEAPRVAADVPRDVNSLKGAQVFALSSGKWEPLTEVSLKDKSYVQLDISRAISALRIVRGPKMESQANLGLGRLVLLN